MYVCMYAVSSKLSQYVCYQVFCRECNLKMCVEVSEWVHRPGSGREGHVAAGQEDRLGCVCICLYEGIYYTVCMVRYKLLTLTSEQNVYVSMNLCTYVCTYVCIYSMYLCMYECMYRLITYSLN